MTRIPPPALVVGYLGLVPFVYGVLLVLVPDGTALPRFGNFAASPEAGLHILQTFGAAILGFMGGCLWGFAAAPGRVPTWALLAASALPPFLALVSVRPEPGLGCIWLAFGFVVVQGIDVLFHRAGVAPDWWLTLRLPLSASVIACLLVGALYA
jgi:hypothetical protein